VLDPALEPLDELLEVVGLLLSLPEKVSASFGMPTKSTKTLAPPTSMGMSQGGSPPGAGGGGRWPPEDD
jgi:hypothetical protein